MNTVFIVPTGIGCSIGGHAGDATPAFKLISSISDIAITHPNVVNASDINEMPENTWYIEGSILDRFLMGDIHLQKYRSNKILLVTNPPIQPETINAVNAARHTIGCDISILELETPLKMYGKFSADGRAIGDFSGVSELLMQLEGYEYDALAIATSINIPKQVALTYFRNGGVNPWGGIEALVSKCIAEYINKPVAHAPVEENDPEIKYFNEVVESRIAAEVLSTSFIHCVFKGLHKAPRISDKGLYVRDIDCLVTPYDCWGIPHEACRKNGVTILGVKENVPAVKKQPKDIYWVDNYVEAAGWLQAFKEGLTRHSISNDYLDEIK